MDIHPWTKYEIAHARHEERVLRGLGAYQALRAREEQAVERDVERDSAGQIRFLDRLLRREAARTHAHAREAI